MTMTITTTTDADFDDFQDLDTYLNSEEFIKAYDNMDYQPTGKSWAGIRGDYSGMTIEDISGFPEPVGYYSSKLN